MLRYWMPLGLTESGLRDGTAYGLDTTDVTAFDFA